MADIIDRQKPGKLTTTITLELNTKQATDLFYGQEGDEKTGKPWVVGLVSYAERLKQINFAAHNNDPYADYYLLKVEYALDKAKKQIKLIDEEMTKYSDRSSLKINQGSSIKPVLLETSFGSVYANIALELLKLTDNVIVNILSLKHIGFLTVQESNIKISSIIKIIRRTFLTCQGYRYTQVTRDDVLAKNVKYRTAHTLMKFQEELPEELLDKNNRTARAKNAPNIKLSLNETFKREPGSIARRRKGININEEQKENGE